MTDKQKLKDLVNKSSKSFDKTTLTKAAQTAADAQVNAKDSPLRLRRLRICSSVRKCAL